MRALCLLILVACFGMPVSGRQYITVDTTAPRMPAASIGTNLNYLVDGPLTIGQLAPLGARVLRYPGGEKSDTNGWSLPPFDRPQPSILRLGPNQWPGGDRTIINADGSFVRPPLDFDQFLYLAQATGATPIVVVPFDSAFAPAEPGGTAPTYDELKSMAVAWVRYAAGRVPYWEIGNESYFGSYNGSPTAAQYAAGVKDFATAMKAADPSIQIGANGGESVWWTTLLSAAGSSIDFLVVHNYPFWNLTSYSKYRNSTASLVSDIDRARTALGSRPLWIALTESGALTARSWAASPDLGHAIMLADVLMAQAQAKGVRLNLSWTSRWVTTASGPRAYDAFDSAGNLTPSGRAQALLATVMRGQVLKASGTSKVHVLALADATGLRIVLLNKDTSSRDVTITVKGGTRSGANVLRTQFGGGSASALSPTTRTRDSASISSSGEIKLTLDPVSLTVLQVAGSYGP